MNWWNVTVSPADVRVDAVDEAGPEDWRQNGWARAGIAAVSEGGGFLAGVKLGTVGCAFSPIAIATPVCAAVGGLIGIGVGGAVQDKVLDGEVSLAHVGTSVVLTAIGLKVFAAVGMPLLRPALEKSVVYLPEVANGASELIAEILEGRTMNLVRPYLDDAVKRFGPPNTWRTLLPVSVLAETGVAASEAGIKWTASKAGIAKALPLLTELFHGGETPSSRSDTSSSSAH